MIPKSNKMVFRRDVVCWPMVSLVARLGVAYTILYSLRNLITTASAFLFDVGHLDRQTFATMQTVSYLFIFLCKFTSGPLLRRVGGFNRLVAVFLSIQLATCLGYIALGAIGMRQETGLLLSCTFVVVYCVVKLSASFTRVTVLELIYRSPDINSGRNTLGVITTMLQVLACVGDSGGKYALGLLLNSHAIMTVADNQRVPRWCLPMMLISSASAIGVLCTATVFKKRRSRTIKTQKGQKEQRAPPLPSPPSPRIGLRALVRNYRFLLCCVTSLVTSMISVTMGTYGSHYMRYKIGIDSKKVPMYDSLSPFFILFGIGLNGFLLNRCLHLKSRTVWFILVPAVITSAMISYMAFAPQDTVGFYTPLALYYIHQTCFYAFQNAMDGAYLMCVVEPSQAPSATGIVSGIGYAGGLIVPFTILKYSTSSDGWFSILRCMFALELFVLLPLIAIVVLDVRRYTEHSQKK